MSCDICDCLGWVIACILSLLPWATIAFMVSTGVLAVAELHYLWKTSNLMGQCDFVWEMLLISCVTNFVYVIASILTRNKQKLQRPTEESKGKYHPATQTEQAPEQPDTCLQQLMSFLKFAASLVIFYCGVWNIVALQDALCEQYWQQHSPELWSLLPYQVATFIIVAILTLAFALSMCASCCACYALF